MALKDVLDIQGYYNFILKFQDYSPIYINPVLYFDYLSNSRFIDIFYLKRMNGNRLENILTNGYG